MATFATLLVDPGVGPEYTFTLTSTAGGLAGNNFTAAIVIDDTDLTNYSQERSGDNLTFTVGSKHTIFVETTVSNNDLIYAGIKNNKPAYSDTGSLVGANITLTWEIVGVDSYWLYDRGEDGTLISSDDTPFPDEVNVLSWEGTVSYEGTFPSLTAKTLPLFLFVNRINADSGVLGVTALLTVGSTVEYATEFGRTSFSGGLLDLPTVIGSNFSPGTPAVPNVIGGNFSPSTPNTPPSIGSTFAPGSPSTPIVINTVFSPGTPSAPPSVTL